MKAIFETSSSASTTAYTVPVIEGHVKLKKTPEEIKKHRALAERRRYNAKKKANEQLNATKPNAMKC